MSVLALLLYDASSRVSALYDAWPGEEHIGVGACCPSKRGPGSHGRGLCPETW